MSVINRTTLDLGAPMVYTLVVDTASPTTTSATQVSTASPRRRRRPPSLAEQQRRTARIRPWAEHWKQLKAAGMWR